MKTARLAQALVVLLVLASCSTTHVLDEEQLNKLRAVEIVVDVPDSNFVYYRVDTASNMPYVAPPPGVSLGTAIAANFFFGVVIGAIDQAIAEAARDAARPVGSSVQDLDLRTMVFSYLKLMAASSSRAPSMSLSSQPFPRPEERQIISSNVPPSMIPASATVQLDPLKPMAQHAAKAQADATLFIKVLPLFTLDVNTPSTVRSAAWLFDKSGRLLHITHRRSSSLARHRRRSSAPKPSPGGPMRATGV
jgi:hypothetical protein